MPTSLRSLSLILLPKARRRKSEDLEVFGRWPETRSLNHREFTRMSCWYLGSIDYFTPISVGWIRPLSRWNNPPYFSDRYDQFQQDIVVPLSKWNGNMEDEYRSCIDAWDLVYFQGRTVKQSQRIHVWYISLHLPSKSAKCRQIYHTWILRELKKDLGLANEDLVGFGSWM